MPNLPCLPDLVIISTESPVALQEDQTGTLPVGILVAGFIQIVGVKVEVLMDHIHHKGEDRQAGWLLLVPEERLVGMDLLIILKVVSMEVPEEVEVRTRWQVIEISSMVGSNNIVNGSKLR